MPNRSLPAVRLLCAAVMLAAAAMTSAAQASADAQDASNVLKMKPGAYVESAIGWNGPIEVKTTVSDNRIDSIEILKSDEVPYIADEPMKAIIQKVVSEQNLSVDVVTGASRSSEALLRAVGQAVQAAGGDLKFFTHEPVPIDPATLPEGEEAQADVVVVGGGASGLAAAAAALESGARVIVLEKAPHTGGSAALSAGIVTAASTDIQKASGLPADSAGLAKLWLEDQKRSVKGAPANLPDAAQVEALVKQSAETVDWLTKKVGMQFSANAAAADGIGAYQLLPISSDASRPAGAEEVEKLEQYVKKLGGIIRTATPAWKILTTDDGRVSGVAAADGKNRFTFRAKSVVLASGGFAADLMKVTSRQPRWAVYVERAGAAKTSTGDGLTMGLQVGAKEVSDSWLMGTQFAPAYPEMTAAMLGERGFAGATLVNEKGLRFVKEDLPNITSEMSQQLDVWLITDSKDPEKAKTLRNYLGFDTVVHGNTPEELGRRMGARADNVKQTIEKLNADAAAGKDTAFGRDPINFTSLTQAPYFAVKVRPVISGTIGGFVVTPDFQVLDNALKPIQGLWAAGELANRAFYNRVYEPGTSLLIAYASGRAAGTSAAKAALSK
ncbi:FAD-dependent oxidoreductase [Sutterella wadsworthensis]|uniref:FAD-dependent oxidoreductase n=1 Tax=Sutterella wadsworthensis TaxID=40545 RepID=UPI000E01195C|nr:FAD-dependent oxidoreductase [Sutterella wadsworthensis]RBP52589.1 fumarate reductase flavoprotein subunit [Sutterella wadsworthensis]